MVSENTDWQVLIKVYLWMYKSGCFDHVSRLRGGDLERGCENTRENAAKLKVARNHSRECVGLGLGLNERGHGAVNSSVIHI